MSNQCYTIPNPYNNMFLPAQNVDHPLQDYQDDEPLFALI